MKRLARPGGIEPTSHRRPYDRRRSAIELRANMARSAGIEPAAPEVISLGALPTELQARGVGGRVLTSGSGCPAFSLELRPRCSFQQRKSGKKFLQKLALGRLDAERHCLPGIWSVGLDDQVSHDSGHLQLRRQPAQLGLILGEEGYSVGAFGKVARRATSCGVDQLGGLRARRNVGAGDAVVGEVRGRDFATEGVTVNVMCSWRATLPENRVAVKSL